eukprot:CAMPEP_0176331288 /NCGR_PEP_ID=MMETSP0121_2-20121125/76476_1 /TAXON_ID=160619 /ORGANISM="Kryptoperidinium foliaceum, Strain CCMP 1326" /LENGTH=159 /DNA_ID=CAMNT_0017674135 /DNA_START=407 /DNA_END=883 /DNA_ORIENTATION=-
MPVSPRYSSIVKRAPLGSGESAWQDRPMQWSMVLILSSSSSQISPFSQFRQSHVRFELGLRPWRPSGCSAALLPSLARSAMQGNIQTDASWARAPGTPAAHRAGGLRNSFVLVKSSLGTASGRDEYVTALLGSPHSLAPSSSDESPPAHASKSGDLPSA